MPKSSVEPRALTASLHIAAAPDVVWALVADVGRTGEWSPECVRVLPVGGPRRGSFLLGIGWTVLTNRAEWTYRLDPHREGTRLTETRRTPRGEGVFAVWFTERLLGGQISHDDELEAGMQKGLQHIKQLLEADA